MTSLFGKPIEEPTGGLRERKKAKTRIAIQQHAVRLFREQGYAATTVEQVAEAAEVSPSTVFRYFPTKEDLVVNDDYDPVIYALFKQQPPELNLIEAWRHTIRDALKQMTDADVETQLDRGRLLLSVPELWGATLHNTKDTMETITRLSAERLGRAPEDPGVQATAGAIFGVMLTAALNWVKTENPKIIETLDTALAQLDQGLLR
jgi:AcrR family transcriptional regulator